MQKSKIIVGRRYEFWLDDDNKSVATCTEYGGNGSVTMAMGSDPENPIAKITVDRSKLIRRVVS